jgi:putative intracellular protease/amidase
LPVRHAEATSLPRPFTFIREFVVSHQPLRQLVIALAVATAAMTAPTSAAAQSPAPVLMVIANRDYWYQEYASLRSVLEQRGLQVVVAAASLSDTVAQGKRLKVPIRADVALTDADAADYSAIVFVGGWGASSYQYAFEGTYANGIYRPVDSVAAAVNRLINDFVAQDKYVVGLSHGVTVLAWARVDGVSPLKGRTVAAWAGGGPGFERDGAVHPDSSVPARAHLEENGAVVKLSAAIGNPLTSADDVWVDGRIITAENPAAAAATGKTLAAALLGK